jgi:hypothetical protein
MFPAQRFTAAQRISELGGWYWSWFLELPDSHLKRFINKGLVPFLRMNGYVLIQPDQKCINALSSWAFSHVQVENQKSNMYEPYLPQSPNIDYVDEWEEFCNRISYDRWMTLCDEWFATEFLDTSDSGLAQRNELPYFVWRLVYLDGSPAHLKWLDNMATQEQADEEMYGIVHVPDEQTHAFGGDRRTL